MIPFPPWVTEFRPHQVECAAEIVEHFQSGERVVFLDGPTGSGKTLIAEMVRRKLNAKALYCCHGKTLQDQFLHDYPYARVLKGRANYSPPYGLGDITCADCTAEGPGSSCVGCGQDLESCPYTVAKVGAFESELAVLNTAYMLGETNSRKTWFGRGAFDLSILDECDTLEREMMGHVEVAIGKFRMEQLKVGLPEFVTKPEAWGVWIRGEVIPAVKKQIAMMPKRGTVAQRRRRQGWSRLLEKLLVLAKGVDDGGWIFDGYKYGGATFKPIHVAEFGDAYLWRHFPRTLLMSATIISPDELAQSLGWEDDWKLVTAPMTFPKANRPIYVCPVTSVTAKTTDQSWPALATAIGNILRLHKRSEKVLVHTVSYKLAEYLMANVQTNRPMFTYADGKGRDAALEAYRGRVGAVIFAPSLDRGVDLPEQDCRVIIVAKLPFPNLGDKQVSARLHTKGGQLWYAVQTVRSLVQMTGRGVRSADDTCVSYILDAQFIDNLWKKSKHLLPQWWRDALDMTYPTKQLKEAM